MTIDLVLMSTTFWFHPIVTGLVVAAPAIFLGVKSLRRVAEADDAAARAAAIAAAGSSVQRVIDGLDRMVANLQTDNREVREVGASLRTDLSACNAELRRLATYNQNRQRK